MRNTYQELPRLPQPFPKPSVWSLSLTVVPSLVSAGVWLMHLRVGLSIGLMVGR